MKLPWWFRKPTPSDEETRVLGEPGEGKVLITTARDAEGYAIERTWMDKTMAVQWDDTRWSHDWRQQ